MALVPGKGVVAFDVPAGRSVSLMALNDAVGIRHSRFNELCAACALKRSGASQ